MQYILGLFVLGILCQNILARGLDNAVLNDFERRLVRLESRQFSESENLEHRMLQLETQAGTQKGEETLERSPLDRNFYEIQKEEEPSESVTLLERLAKVEKNWEKQLEEHLEQFSSKYDSLSERFSAIEKHVEELKKPSWHQVMEGLRAHYEKPKSDDADTDEASGDDNTDEPNSDEPKSDEAKNYEDEESNFHSYGGKIYYIENNEKDTWSDALLKCRELNAQLVSLKNEDEWRSLKEVLKAGRSYWTDINDIQTEGSFVSRTTGTLAPFLKWDDDEPNSLPGAEDCVELRSDSGYKMNDVNCNAEKFYICESIDEDRF